LPTCDPFVTTGRHNCRKPPYPSAGFLPQVFKRYGPFDYVYHLAAYAAEGLSHFIRRYNYMNNLVASVTLLDAAVTCN